jgi:putative inorganic carbon (HCO3(-)) transporter
LADFSDHILLRAARAFRVSLSTPEVHRETTLRRLTRWALLVTIAAAPAYVLRWRLGPFPTTALENLILLTVGLHLCDRWMRGDWRFPRTPYDFPIALLLVAGAVAVVVAPTHGGALGIYRAFFLEPIAAYYVAVSVLRTPEQLRPTLLALGMGTAIVALLNLAANASLLRVGTFQLGATVPVAVYLDPNSVAMFLGPVVGVATGFLLFSRQPRERALAAIFLVVLGPALLLTFSRGAYLAIAGLLAFGVLSVGRRWATVIVGSTAVLLGLAAWRAPHALAQVLQGINAKDPSNVALSFRLSVWKATIQLLQDHPLLGVGLRGYKTVIRSYIPAGAPNDALYAHNLWLTFWAEVGLLGVVAFALIYFGLLWRGARGLRHAATSERPLRWGLTAAFLMIGIHGLLDTPYWKNDLSLEFWMLAGVEVALLGALRPAGRGEGAPQAAPSSTPR